MGWPHTNADTIDKVNIQVFRCCVATPAVTSYILADMLDTLN